MSFIILYTPILLSSALNQKVYS
uniref:Uncharacterized protein n=1 Tax=Anguilla anguilla TaxID=7936 RepID=A0A0E9TSL2_ANGAN